MNHFLDRILRPSSLISLFLLNVFTIKDHFLTPPYTQQHLRNKVSLWHCYWGFITPVLSSLVLVVRWWWHPSLVRCGETVNSVHCLITSHNLTKGKETLLHPHCIWRSEDGLLLLPKFIIQAMLHEQFAIPPRSHQELRLYEL